jgi:hypothetical protein
MNEHGLCSQINEAIRDEYANKEAKFLTGLFYFEALYVCLAYNNRTHKIEKLNMYLASRFPLRVAGKITTQLKIES